MLLPVVLAGGVGSRLWPLSTPSNPKQFADLPGRPCSLFTETLRRLQRLRQLDSSPLVVCNYEHKLQAARQLQKLGEHNRPLLLEPVGRNTAAAIALAAFYASQAEADPLLLVCPADHVIESEKAFSDAVNESIPLAEQGNLVTFGVKPNRPETGFGYIECGDPLFELAGWKVKSFTEKPNEALALSLIARNRYLWNSGIFVFQASSFLKQLELLAPEIYRVCRLTFSAAEKAEDFIRFQEKDFRPCPSESVDYAVMEKTSAAAVIKVDMGWHDLGTWEGLSQGQDGEGVS